MCPATIAYRYELLVNYCIQYYINIQNIALNITHSNKLKNSLFYTSHRSKNTVCINV